MNDSDLANWLDEKTKELLEAEVQIAGEYDEEVIREYLIFTQYDKAGKKLINFFSSNKDNENLLKVK